MVKKIVLLSVMILGFSLNSISAQTSTKGHIETVNVSDFSELVKLKKGVLLDVRTANEFKSGHIEGAKNVVYSMFGFDAALKGLDKNETYFIYCRSGARSSRALKIMIKEGFKNIYNLNGGLMAWQGKGLPVVQ